MATEHMLAFVFMLHACLQLTCSLDVKKFALHMPNVHPDKDEDYLCTPVRVIDNKNFYIVGFEPNASMNVVHHMLLFGCTEPGSTEPFWDCGEMVAADSDAPRANPCGEGSHVIYAWARNAKSLQLPEDVGFLVGPGTGINYLVLQIHYSKKFPDGLNDSSGLNLLYTEEKQNKLAGVLLLATGGTIPPNSITHMEASCEIKEDKIIHPFAYRTHTHMLGQAVSGYKVRRDESGVDHWTLLGKRNPLTPQMFYPIFDTSPIKHGDRLAARCTMNSTTRTTITKVGPTNKDEMCNFYMMYYVENGTPLEIKYCSSEGPPYFYWTDGELNNIPDADASEIV